MIEVLIPPNPEFQKYEAQIKELYEKTQNRICDPNPFSFIKENTLFYLFLIDGTVIGAIYYFMDDGKLFLNGFAYPKHHTLNLKCLYLSLNWFSQPVYAEAQNRASALCLLRCGFKRVKDNLFCFKKDYYKGAFAQKGNYYDI